MNLHNLVKARAAGLNSLFTLADALRTSNQGMLSFSENEGGLFSLNETKTTSPLLSPSEDFLEFSNHRYQAPSKCPRAPSKCSRAPSKCPHAVTSIRSEALRGIRLVAYNPHIKKTELSDDPNNGDLHQWCVSNFDGDLHNITDEQKIEMRLRYYDAQNRGFPDEYN